MILRSTRRGFIGGLLSLFAAPAIVRASSLDFIPRGIPLEGISQSYFGDADNYEYWVSLAGNICRMTEREILAAPRGVIQPWLPALLADGNWRLRPANEHKAGLIFRQTGEIISTASLFDADPAIVRLREENDRLNAEARRIRNVLEREYDRLESEVGRSYYLRRLV